MIARRERRFAIDTNLFIQGYRNESDRDALEGFLRAFAPFCVLPVIVAQELIAGVLTSAEARLLDKHLVSRFARRGLLLVPSAKAWMESGRVLHALVVAEGLELATVSKAFGNDVLLAATCREQGVCLVTENTRDFTRIRRHLHFDFVGPWPV